jgi:hypothetical protein
MAEWMNTHDITILVIGFALGHIDDLVDYAFHALMRIPMLRAWIVKNPDKAKATIDAIQKELDKDIDETAKPH